jgi:WD40 repeat protein
MRKRRDDGRMASRALDPLDAEVRGVEARIAEELLPLLQPRPVAGTAPAPPAYVRRHLVEHAAAGEVLDERFLSPQFLPYVDASRLRALSTGGAGVSSGLLPLWRRIAYSWEWDSPAANRDSLQFWLAAQARHRDRRASAEWAWGTRWAHWPAERGEVLVRCPGHTASLSTVVTPDGRAVVITATIGGGDNGDAVRVWDLITGLEVCAPLGPVGYRSTLATAVLPDGRAVAVIGGESGALQVWDLETGGPIGAPWPAHPAGVAGVATVSLPDGRVLAVSSSGGAVEDRCLRLWNLADRTLVARWPADEIMGGAMATAVLPDGQPVVVLPAPHGSLCVLNLASGDRTVHDLLDNASTPYDVATAVLPDRRVVAVTAGGFGSDTMQVWDLVTHTPVCAPMTGHTGPVETVATTVLPDGRVVAVTGSRDHSTRVWDLTTGAPVGAPMIGDSSDVFAVATARLPRGRVVAVTAGGWDETIRLWDLPADTTVDAAPPGGSVGSTAVAPVILSAGRMAAVTAGRDRVLRVWDLDTGTPRAVLPTAHGHDIRHVATATVRGGGRVFAVTSGGWFDLTAYVWDLSAEPVTAQPLAYGVSGVVAVDTALLPDGRVVAIIAGSSVSRGSISVWDLATREPLRTQVSFATDAASSVAAMAAAVLPDGRLMAIVGLLNGPVRTWDLTNRKPVGPAEDARAGTADALATVALPGGRVVAVSGRSDGEVRLWDLHTGTADGPPLCPGGARIAAVATAVLPDGRAVAFASSTDATVRGWDLGTRRPLVHPLRAVRGVGDLCVLPGRAGPRLVLGGAGVACVDVRLNA